MPTPPRAKRNGEKYYCAWCEWERERETAAEKAFGWDFIYICSIFNVELQSLFNSQKINTISRALLYLNWKWKKKKDFFKWIYLFNKKRWAEIFSKKKIKIKLCEAKNKLVMDSKRKLSIIIFFRSDIVIFVW